MVSNQTPPLSYYCRIYSPSMLRIPPPLTLFLFAFGFVACGGPASAPADAPAAYDEGEITIRPVTADELVEEVRAVDADLVVVNFWASWCLPCREEFPDFMRYDREHDDVAVRFVSADFEDEVDFAAEFLEEQGYTGTSYLKVGRDSDFINAVATEWTGSIPATVVYDSAGNRLAFWEGKVSYEELAARVDDARQTL